MILCRGLDRFGDSLSSTGFDPSGDISVGDPERSLNPKVAKLEQEVQETRFNYSVLQATPLVIR